MKNNRKLAYISNDELIREKNEKSQWLLKLPGRLNSNNNKQSIVQVINLSSRKSCSHHRLQYYQHNSILVHLFYLLCLQLCFFKTHSTVFLFFTVVPIFVWSQIFFSLSVNVIIPILYVGNGRIHQLKIWFSSTELMILILIYMTICEKLCEILAVSFSFPSKVFICAK